MRHTQRKSSRLAVVLFSAYALVILSAVVYLRVSSPHSTAAPLTSLSPDGVRSTAVVAENKLPGTTAWRIAPGANTTAIQGYSSSVQAQVGQVISLYVRTTSPRYVVQAYRMGWYQGLGGRLVWSSRKIAAVVQPACTLDTSINMVACSNWKISARMQISEKFPPGDYLLKLVASNGATSYVPLTVWDPHSSAAYVLMNRSLIEQGENTFGGYSLYSGEGPCIIDQKSSPACNRARVVSFDRPYATGDGAADFLTNEFPLVSFVEKEGLDVTYITDVTLSSYPNVLAGHRALISLAHDVAWTDEERVALQSAQSHGLNAVFFGGGAMTAHVRLEPSVLGLNRQEVDYRNAAEDPLNAKGPPDQVTSNTWSDPPASWPPTAQVGEEYGGQLTAATTAPMIVTDANSWIFQGTGLTNDSSLPGVIASDFDDVVNSAQTPSSIEVAAHSPVPPSHSRPYGAHTNGAIASDVVYFASARSHAGTFDVGTNGWMSILGGCAPHSAPCASPILSKVTNNVLHVFGLGPAGLNDAPRANVASLKLHGF